MPPPRVVGVSFFTEGPYIERGPPTTRSGVVIAAEGDPRANPRTARVTVRYDDTQEEAVLSLDDIENMASRWRWGPVPSNPNRIPFQVTFPVVADDGWFWFHDQRLIVDVMAHDHQEAVAIVGAVLSAEVRGHFPLHSGFDHERPLPTYDKFSREHAELVRHANDPNRPPHQPRNAWERLPVGASKALGGLAGSDCSSVVLHRISFRMCA